MKKHCVPQWVTLAMVVAYAWTPVGYAQNSNGSQVSPETRLRYVGKNRPVGEVWPETNLYFGSSKPDGTVVTPEEFNYFLDHEITPRFPDGLTLLVGLGQFRNSSGTILKERSMLLILLYPPDPEGSKKIEEIRDLYKSTFQQESVLRVDKLGRVSF
jgi:hypothetical protein